MTSTTSPPVRQGFSSTDLGLLVMAAIWGVNFTVVKGALDHMPALAFNGLRVALAAVVLMAVAFTVAGVRRFPSRRDTFALLALGLLGNGVYQLAFIGGLSRTRAGIAALVIAAGPAWIAVLLRLMGRERVPARGWAGIGLQLLGMACVVASAGLLDAGSEALIGAAMIMGGSVAWAVFTVLLQPYTATVHPLHLAALTLSSGAVVLFAMGLPSILALDYATVTLADWGAVIYAGVGALVVAYLLFYRGVRMLGPTKTAMYANLQPLIAVLVAWVVLSERPTAWQLVGGVLVMAGLLLYRTRQRLPSHRVPGASTGVATGSSAVLAIEAEPRTTSP